MSEHKFETLAEALTAALGQLGDIAKGRTADLGNYRYTYADLSDALDHVRPILSLHGLAVLQNVTSEQQRVGIETIILHSSGQEMRLGPLWLHAGNTPQQAGSAITYARRYALLAALGIATEDDDGQAAAAAPRQQPRPAVPEPRTEEEATIREMLSGLSRDERASIIERFTFEFDAKLIDLDPERHAEALAWIEDNHPDHTNTPEEGY